jgi:hypothetical protein
VRWLDPESRVPSENVVSVTVNDLSKAFAAASPRLRVDYTAAFFAEVLRKSLDPVCRGRRKRNRS